MKNNTWVRVVFSDECDEFGNCPICRIDYTECPCPGPTMDEEYEYRMTKEEGLEARKRQLLCTDDA